ncbi:MAG: hypothetical protein L6R48_15275 [Planctomycetes bacterium]|nr:hypothetical protein [Planctomycetota bacterium]
MPTAVTVPNTLGPHLVALSAEAVAQVAELERLALAIPALVTEADMRAADDLIARANKLAKGIEAGRKALKAPIADMVAKLDMAAADALLPLATIKTDLGARVLAWTTAENARREAERKRIEAERAAAAEAERAAAAEAARLAAEKAAAATTADPDQVPEPWEQAPAPAEVVHVPAVLPPSYEQQMAMAPIKSKSVVQRTNRTLVIDDVTLIPREVAGAPLWVLDTAAVTRLLKANVAVPGCHLSSTPTVSAKG